jgi:release factor glutamine methyltransferase
MTVQAAFTHIIQSIRTEYEEREAANIAHMVVEHITGLNRLDRIVHKERALSEEQQQQLRQAITALLQHQPIQYILGNAWFYGMELQVNENVLIPRPETEELVEWIITDVRESHQTEVRLLDIGTGSGCIPLALKKELPSATVWAVDVSPGALEVARKNAGQQKLSVQFVQMDVLNEQAVQSLPVFNIIVSNPPYIKQSESAVMQERVLAFEPSLALFVPDEDPLRFYRHITLLAKTKLLTGGTLYFEINEALGQEVVALLEQEGFHHVILKQDLFGKDRMVKATWMT